ncbi:TadE family protein [Agromyces binzhouensis]|uniref:TadE family protein n=1 Tax=Agromyces binzhouensis TaxID=1817495 RepID=UPI0013EDAF04|nr:TadE family protein [Agromyces binzhouensis]
MPRSRCSTDPRRLDLAAEAGSASLEFLTVGMILLVPLVYLVLAMASIQAAALGVEGAARQAARVAVLRTDAGEPSASVDRTVRVVLADYGVDAGAASVMVECSGPCTASGTRVSVAVGAAVALPLVPQVLASRGIGTVRLEARATQTVSRFAGAP